MKGSTLVLTVIALGIGVQVAIVGAIVTKPADRKAMASNTGFVKVARPEGAVANEVLIVGPNCNRPEGVRTRALASSLAARNIPYRQTDSISLSADAGWDGIAQMNDLIKQDSPLVFINARGKANPTLDEVVAEYRQATAR